eukprot:6184943-Pleurochrysis_carterae.AAC.2
MYAPQPSQPCAPSQITLVGEAHVPDFGLVVGAQRIRQAWSQISHQIGMAHCQLIIPGVAAWRWIQTRDASK